MSARSFFDNKRMYPVFTLLLGFILMNPIFIFNREFSQIVIENAVFLGIITIVGISPLGFLAAQFWHVSLAIYRSSCLCFRKSLREINELIEFTDDNNQKSWHRNHSLLMIRDFFFHYHVIRKQGEKKGMYIGNYLSRRWDLINTLGSGLPSYFVGAMFGFYYNGLLMRDSTQINLFNETITINADLIINNVSKILIDRSLNLPNHYWIGVWAFSIFFTMVSLLGILIINKERQEFIWAIFRQNDFTASDIKKAFPNTKARY